MVERLAGPTVTADAAAAVGWQYYRTDPPVTTGAGVPDPVAIINAGYRWDPPTLGVLLTDGVGEIELASAFDAHGQPLAARTLAGPPTALPVVLVVLLGAAAVLEHAGAARTTAMNEQMIEQWVQYTHLDKLYSYLPGMAEALPAVFGALDVAHPRPGARGQSRPVSALAGQVSIVGSVIELLTADQRSAGMIASYRKS
ncbi:hypothetical protein [Pseudonocardia asaccharolytica]|uniref:Uncharacterized protein n=1 Tax=Pseudonocardia asaccharolytica DSM 44247 = NBRC 16224 TaxID=1123024 RepID=A0A511D6F1_9PSEU|nr:hypothetical protein [Pseudonocardia asaccharolytica]GEL20043.1 hypothetical protein PA7_38800 [Pseudonocardia asaccharolytica DSM 44247 = NBRC 16224]